MKTFFASVAVVAALSIPAAAQDADTVLATVGEREITLGHMIAMLDRLPPEFQTLPDAQLYEGMLEQLINQEVLAASVRSNPSRLMQLGLENEERAYLSSRLVESVRSEEVSDADLQAAYEAQFAAAAPEPEFNASHILVATEEEAASLVTQAREGADFAELARTFSTGPSGPNGGELGWFGLGRMVPAFEQAVLGLEVGAVSDPVETQFGWHVVRLNDQREIGAPPLDAVRAELIDQLRTASLADLIDSLRTEQGVVVTQDEIDPSVIRNMDLVTE